MDTKPGVSILGIRPELVFGLVIAKEVYDARRCVLEVTSCADGVHGVRSYHYKGLAADLRTKGTGLPRQLRDDLVRRLSKLDFDVVLEDEEGPNEHIHLEFDERKAKLRMGISDNPLTVVV